MIRIFLAFLFLLCSNAWATVFTDLKFGQSQIADSQWNVSSCTQTTTCQIYSTSPGTMYKIPWYTGQWSWSSGQYVQFTETGNATNPYEGKVYNSNGSLAGTIGTGHIVNMGTDSNGKSLFFFVGNDNDTGQLFSTNYGLTGTGGYTWTGTLNPTVAQVNSFASTGSTSPLSAGQSASPPPNPTKIYSSSYNANAAVRIISITPTSNNSPSNEQSPNAFDNNPYTKYLNFDKYNAGVTVKLNSGRVVTGFTITTANDFSGRDPTSYKLYGSNDGVNWTKIQEGNLSLSNSRYTESSVVSVTSSTAYVYYYMYFPTTKAGNGCGQDCNSMQISELTYIYDANSTVTSSDAGNGSIVDPVQAAPTVVSTSVSNSVSTSSSNTNTNSISVTRPTTTGNYTDGFVGTTTVTTTTTTPVTTTNWSDGSTTTSNGTSTSTTSTTYTITPTLGTAPTYSRTAPNTSGNSVYIKQTSAWANTQVSVTQDGNNNAVTGTDSSWATVNGNGSLFSIEQYGQGNIIGVKMNAWGNNIDIKQKGVSGDVNNNIFNIESNGNGNAVTLQQQTNTNTASVKITYDINTVNLTQKGGTGNTSYITMNGNWNTATNTQNGSNNFSLINISGDNNTATVIQTGNSHSTLLNLINAGGANTVSVTQTGTGDTYSLQQTCTNPSGCSVSVVRNK